MSLPNRRKRRRRAERSALQIAEESFHLLRSVDLRYYWIHYLGAVPFAVVFLYFVADTSRSGLAEETILASSLLLTGLWAAMKVCQGRFCEGLWNTLSPFRREWTKGERLRRTAALLAFQAFSIPLWLIGLFFVIPLGWIVAGLQNGVALAYSGNTRKRPLRRLVGDSFRLSHDDWAQNHALLLLFLFVALFTWINIVATAITVPTLIKAFFGVESVFTVSPTAAVLNSTFFLGTFVLTHLVISPMLKAAYVLRCFYSESRTTGDDLLSRLAASEKRRKKKRERSERSPSTTGARSTKAALVLLTLFCLGSTGGIAEENAATAGGADALGTPPAAEVDRDALREQITETLEQKKYQWQLSRNVLEAGEGAEEQSWLSKRVREIADATREAMESFSEWVEEAFERWSREDRPRVRPPSGGDFSFFDEISSALSVGLVVLVLGLVAWLGWLAYRHHKSAAKVKVEESASESIDLQSEEIVASQLPEDEWIRLARDQIERGDGRLAVRALFLACLANLGEAGVLKIERFKSNRDYRIELARRARKRATLLAAFEENTRIFERVWYGGHPVTDGVVESYLARHGTIVDETRQLPARPDLVRREAAAT